MFKIPFLRKLYLWYRERYFWRLKKKGVEQIFSDIYKNNEWGTDELPDADLVTIRQVLQHLSNEQISKILSKLSKFKYVIITEHILLGDFTIPNLDKIPGPHIRTKVFSSVIIDAPPFKVKNATVLSEHRFDEKVKSKLYPAVIRTYLITTP